MNASRDDVVACSIGVENLSKFVNSPTPLTYAIESAYGTTFFNIFTVGVIIAKPNVFGAFSAVSVGSLIVIFFSGPVIYFIVRQRRLQSSSIDMDLAMRELPPE